MPEYLSPGVYVEEVSGGAKPIESVGTAMPVFIGYSEKAETSREIDGEMVTQNLLGKPQVVTNWTQYVERFGAAIDGAYLPHSVYGYFLNGGSRCYVLSVKTIPRAQTVLLNSKGKPKLIVQAKNAGFSGTKLRVKIETADSGAKPKADSKAKDEAKAKDEGDDKSEASPSEPDDSFDIIVERQGPSGAWLVAESFRQAKLVEAEDSEGLKSTRVAYRYNRAPQLIEILVPENGSSANLAELSPRTQQQSLTIQDQLMSPVEYSDYQGDVTDRTGIEGLAELDDATMLVIPDLMNVLPGQKLDLEMVKGVQTAMIAHCELMGDRVAILDAPVDMNPQEVREWRMDTTGYDSSYAALYYPWIEIMNPVTNRRMPLPPSGHLAGVWARSDNTRGVHKAPANEIVQGAVGLTRNVTKGEQDILNPDSINCIRAFPGMGIRVWGARTLSSDPEWRYVSVRRLFNMVKKSVERGTMWTVFEPNDERLWGRISRTIAGYLSTVWGSGALFGSSPTEAYFVKCDSELNPPEVRDAGQLVVEIGIAPVKPAEFVIFRISQWSETS